MRAQHFFWLLMGLAILTSGFYSHAKSPLASQRMALSSPTIKQGETALITVSDIRSLGDSPVVWFLHRTIHVFPQPDGTGQAVLSANIVAPTGEQPIELRDSDGHTATKTVITVLPVHYPSRAIHVSKQTEGLQPLPGEMEAVGNLKQLATATRYWETPFVAPTPDCQNSPFGVKSYYNGKYTGNYHKGLDLRSPMSRPIRAMAGGKVVIAKMFRLHGGTVGLDHGQGVSSIYIHLSKIAVHEGETVQQGSIIGYVGSTGFATGPHLHFGLFVSGEPVNPRQWIPGIPLCG